MIMTRSPTMLAVAVAATALMATSIEGHDSSLFPPSRVMDGIIYEERNVLAADGHSYSYSYDDEEECPVRITTPRVDALRFVCYSKIGGVRVVVAEIPPSAAVPVDTSSGAEQTFEYKILNDGFADSNEPSGNWTMGTSPAFAILARDEPYTLDFSPESPLCTETLTVETSDSVGCPHETCSDLFDSWGPTPVGTPTFNESLIQAECPVGDLVKTNIMIPGSAIGYTPAGAPLPGNPPVAFSYIITQGETTLLSPPTWSIGDDISVELASNARASITIAADVYSPIEKALLGCAESFEFTPCDTAGVECAAPEEAFVKYLQCIVNRDPVCMARSYGVGYESWYHGEYSSDPPANTVEYWDYFVGDTLNFVDTSFEIKSKSRLSKNQAEIRWVHKSVTLDGSAFGLPPSSEYPFSQTYVMHRAATVEVDDYCKIIKRDVTEDDDDEWALMLAAVQEVKCAIDEEESDCATLAPTGAPPS